MLRSFPFDFAGCFVTQRGNFEPILHFPFSILHFPYLCSMKKKAFLFLAVLVVFSQQAWAQGCSQCKLLAEQGSEMDEAAFGSNINIGILYLMIIPYLLLMFLFRKRIITFFRGLFSKKA